MSGIEPDSPDSCSCGARVSPLARTNTGRKSLGYRRLPPQSLRLSVLKLDGSCFDIQVPTAGTVSELKDAVEEVFSQLSKTRESRISWSLVWGHFCLSYKGHKLLDDNVYIRHLGVKDDDQAYKLPPALQVEKWRSLDSWPLFLSLSSYVLYLYGH